MDGDIFAAVRSLAEMTNRQIGLLPFIEADQIQRAKEKFQARTSAVTTDFNLANRERSPSLYASLVKEAREATETLAEAAAARGVHLPNIQLMSMRMLGQFIADIKYICRTDPECLAAVDHEAQQAEAYIRRQLRIGHIHADTEVVRAWIIGSGLNNSKIAWTIFHSQPDFHGVKQQDFKEIWGEAHPRNGRGRPSNR